MTKLVFAPLFALLLAAPARAEIGFGFAAGVRSMEMGLMLENAAFQEARGTEAAANFYFAPGKLPFAVTLGIARQDYDLNKARHYFDHLDVTETQAGVGLVPQGSKARPVIRLNYTFLGTANATTSGTSSAAVGGAQVDQTGESSWTMKVTGMHLLVGTELEIGKGALLSLGLDFAQTKAELTSVSLGGTNMTSEVKDAGVDKFKMKSTAVLLGGEVAL